MEGTITVGSWVEIRDGQLQEHWRIVTAHEADAMRRMISDASPLARALLGHSPGDVVQVQGPEGRRRVTVLAVSGSGERPAR